MIWKIHSWYRNRRWPRWESRELCPHEIARIEGFSCFWGIHRLKVGNFMIFTEKLAKIAEKNRKNEKLLKIAFKNFCSNFAHCEGF